jgi:hypothetical protein
MEGGARPLLLHVLLAAKAWGKAPWEITGNDTKRMRLRWLFRWVETKRLLLAKGFDGDKV